MVPCFLQNNSSSTNCELSQEGLSLESEALETCVTKELFFGV